MAKRLENPNVDDLGRGGFELTAPEFEALLAHIQKYGCREEVISRARSTGLIAPIQRNSGTEEIFQWMKMQPDVMVLAVCREGSLCGMKAFIQFMQAEGTWPAGNDGPMSEAPAIRPDVVQAILDYLNREDGRTWFQIDYELANSGGVPPGPYMAEVWHLVLTRRLRRDGNVFWLIRGNCPEA